MKKMISLAMVLTMALGLAACGGSAKYEEQTFTLSRWEVTITNDEVVFSESENCDVLNVYVTAKNTGEDAAAYSSTANVNPYQGEDRLDSGELGDYSQYQNEVEPGETIDVVYSWELIDDRDVIVNFGGYTVAVEDTDITFVVRDRITDEWKAAQEAAAAELAEKMDVSTVSLEGGVTVDVADGWYVDDSDDSEVTVQLNDESGNVEVKTSNLWGTAQEWAEKMAGNYQKDASVLTTQDINGTTYICLPVNDTQFMLFADIGDGYAVRMYGMFISLDDAMAQMELVTLP